jgi:hypothetical protein
LANMHADAGCWMQYGVAWQVEIGAEVQCEGMMRRKRVGERREGKRERVGGRKRDCRGNVWLGLGKAK